MSRNERGSACADERLLGRGFTAQIQIPKYVSGAYLPAEGRAIWGGSQVNATCLLARFIFGSRGYCTTSKASAMDESNPNKVSVISCFTPIMTFSRSWVCLISQSCTRDPSFDPPRLPVISTSIWVQRACGFVRVVLGSKVNHQRRPYRLIHCEQGRHNFPSTPDTRS